MSFRATAKRIALAKMRSRVAAQMQHAIRSAQRGEHGEAEHSGEIEYPNFQAWVKTSTPPGWSYDAPHHQAIAGLFDRMAIGEVDRARVHMPPRHGKTQTLLRLVAYLLLTQPGVRILLTSYNQRFANRLSRAARILSVMYGVTLASDKTASDEWQTGDGSLVMARGVGTPPTGEGFDWILIDDPIKSREDAESEVFRDKLWDWYTDDLYTRLQPKGRVVGIWTRWHEDDLAGRLSDSETLGGDKFHVLKLSAVAGEDDALGREPGDALWPEVWPIDALGRIHRQFQTKGDERSWLALYQQEPTAPEGSMFHPAKIEVVDALPHDIEWWRAWDVASGSGSGDWTVGAKVGVQKSTGLVFIASIVRGQWDTHERDKIIRQTAEADGPGVRISLPQDPGAAGKAQTRYWASSTVAGFSFEFSLESGDKVTRAGPSAAQVNAGHVRMLRGAWNASFREELRQFPGGKHDDQVDAFARAYNRGVRRTISLEIY